MKMGAGLFWGLILIIIGLSIIFRIFFDINILRIVIAVIFILIGIKILIGRPVLHTSGRENTVFFGERRNTASPVDGMDYNTVFGKTVYDLRNLDSLPDPRTRITVNTVFGNTEIWLSPALPVKIKADAVFATASMPNGNSVAFGSTAYSSHNAADSASVLEIEAHVVFGALLIKQ